MRVRLFCALTLAAALCTKADEKIRVLQAGSETYSNVTVTTVSATDLFFTFAGGMGNVKIKNLSPELQQHFHFDPKKAKAVEALQAANKLKYHEQLIHQPEVHPPDMTKDSGGGMPASGPGKKLWAKSFLNQKAPDLIVEKWLTPQPDLRGKFVLLDFWATWCPPCRAAIPELNGYQHKFGDRLVVIGISNETEDAVRRFAAPPIEYSVAIDTQARTKNAVDVTGIPHVLIIDPQGFVRWEGFPFLEGYELNEKVVADILARFSK